MSTIVQPTPTNQSGAQMVLGKELGRGGEGAVFALANQNNVVAKVYHPDQRTLERAEKLALMVANPPGNVRTQLSSSTHPSLAWPIDLLLMNGTFVGFTMPRIDKCPNIFEIYNPKLRAMRYPRVDRRFLYHTASNLAAVMASLHASGYMMGDVNQKNILVNPQAMITLVDTDSFQVGDGKGQFFRCAVGVPEYTAPELQGKVLAQTDRQPMHDCFGMSVLLFQLLMEGYHPFTGRPQSAQARQVSQLSLHCIEWGIFPYQLNGDVQPPPGAPNFGWLHPDLQELFIATFLLGHRNPQARPTALRWAYALRKAEEMLKHCECNPTHWFSHHLDYCPYCGKVPRVMAHGLSRKASGGQRISGEIPVVLTIWDALAALVLPILIVVAIPTLWWLIQHNLWMLLFAPLGILSKLKLWNSVGHLLRHFYADTMRGVKMARYHLERYISIEMFSALVAAALAICFLALVLLQPASPPPDEKVRSTATPTLVQIQPIQVVSPIQVESPLSKASSGAPLLLVAATITPGK